MAGAGVGAADDCEQVVLEPSGLQMPELHEGYVWTGVPLWGVAQDTADAGVMQKWIYDGLPSTPAFTTTKAVQTPTVETRDATSERYLDLWVSRYIDAFEVEVASTPAITSINPSKPVVSSTRQYVSVCGTGFVSDSTVTLFIGSSTYLIPPDRTDFKSATEIKVYVGLTDTSTWTVQVTNPGSKKSNIFSFTVQPDIPTPKITSINPSKPVVNPAKQYVSVYGTGFVSDSTVTLFIGSSTHPIPSDRTDFKSATEIKVYVGLTDTGTWTVQVTNPESKKSNIFSFTVQPDIPTPAITVSTNLDQATFTITGPKTYQDSGKSWSTSDAPAGTYTITYGEVSGYVTPSSETDTLSDGGSITFSGTYLYSGNGELGGKAANLAMQVVGKGYHQGDTLSKGWTDGRFLDPQEIQYLDCSGLVYWSYNRGWEMMSGQRVPHYSTWYEDNNCVDEAPHPVFYLGASGQWNDGERFEQISTAIPTVSAYRKIK
jgi:hypothetical protein